MAQKEVNVDTLMQLNAYASELNINLKYHNSYTLGRECDVMSRTHPGILPYPEKDYFTTYNLYRNGEVLGRNFTKAMMDAKCKELGVDSVLFEQNFDKAGYDAAAQGRIREFDNKLSFVFENGLKYIDGVMDHPKAGLAYSIAYDRGHSGGYGEVAGYWADLVTLIQP